MIEEPYDKPLSYGQVAVREDRWPHAIDPGVPIDVPAPTGFYPGVRGHLQHPVEVDHRAFEELYHETIVGSLNYTEDIDQHPWVQVDATWTPAPNMTRPDGKWDPLCDGPPPPTLRDLSLHYRKWAGASVTRFADVPGVTFPPTGTQDGSSWTYLQSPALAQQHFDPALNKFNESTGQIEGGMPDTLRTLPPSPVHGWTARAVLTPQQEVNLKAAALQQQTPGRQERLAPSSYAGQSYGQGTAVVAGPVGSVPSMRPRG